MALAAFPIGSVTANGHDYNSNTCGGANKEKASVGIFESSKEGLFHYSQVDLVNVPEDCRPTNTTVYGAWYKLNVPGSANMTLASNFYASENGVNYANYSISVLKGDCDSLTCIKYSESQPSSKDTMEASAPFNLIANTNYFLLVTVAVAPNAVVPSIGLKLDSPEAECKLFRSNQINSNQINSPSDDQYNQYNGEGLGSCTPCKSESTEDTTVWTTTCSDACKRCALAPRSFCYTESRKWTKTTFHHHQVTSSGGEQTIDIDTAPPVSTTKSGFGLSHALKADIKTCYDFEDGTSICDRGERDPCPIEVNNVACNSCELRSKNDADCPPGSLPPYMYLKADCSNLGDGSGMIDMCLRTFETSSPAMENYRDHVFAVLGNQVEPNPEQCTAYDDGGLPPSPQVTPAPTVPAAPTPAPEVLEFDEDLEIRSEEFHLIKGESKVFQINVAGKSGVLECELEADDDGDADMYVGVDENPFGKKEFAGCLSEKFESEEACDVVIYGNENVFVMVYGYQATEDVEVKCDLEYYDDDELKDASGIGDEVGVEDKDVELDAQRYELRRVEVPAEAARVYCVTETEGGGDLDLFMRIGGLPVPFRMKDYFPEREFCESVSYSGREYCDFTLTEGDDRDNIYVLLQGFGNVTDGSVKCVSLVDGESSLREKDAESLDLDDWEKFDLYKNENRLFDVTLPQGTRKVLCETESKEDVDLYLRDGEIPILPDQETFTGGTFDCGALSPNGDESCPQDFPGGIPAARTEFVVVSGFQASEGAYIRCKADAPILDEDDADDIDLRSWESVDLEEEKFYAGLFKFDVGRGGRFARCEMRCDDNCGAQVVMRRNTPPLGPDDASNDCSINRLGARCEINYPSGAPGDEEIFVAIYNQGERENLDDTFEIRCDADLTEDDAQRLGLEDVESVNLDGDEQALFFLDLNEYDYDDDGLFGVICQVSGALEILMRVGGLPRLNLDGTPDRFDCRGSGCTIRSEDFSSLLNSRYAYVLVPGGEGEVVCSSISLGWIQNGCGLRQNNRDVYGRNMLFNAANYFDSYCVLCPQNRPVLCENSGCGSSSNRCKDQPFEFLRTVEPPTKLRGNPDIP